MHRDLNREPQYEAGDNEDDGGDVFLSGSAYWQGDVTQQHGNRPVIAPHRRSGYDILDNSTISIAGNQWQQQCNAVQNELDEFEQIEKQLEISNTSTLVRDSQSTNNHFNNNHNAAAQNLQHKTQPDPLQSTVRGEEEGNYGGDWDDAYEHEQFETTDKSLSFGLHTTTSYAPDKSADSSNLGQTYEERESGMYDHSIRNQQKQPDTEDFMSSDLDDTRASRGSFTATGGRAVRPNVVQSNRSEDVSRERSESPNAGASARVGSQAGTAAARASESPSWGRVTRPSEDFYAASDEGQAQERSHSSEQQQHRQRDQRESMKVARMSNSALKKISSRTAALHNPPAQHRVARPTLADDTNVRASREEVVEEEYSEQEEPARDVVYTRPVSTQRLLSNTHSTTAGNASNTTSRPRSGSAGGRLASRRGGGAGATSSHSQSALSEKARDLAAELETYRYVRTFVCFSLKIVVSIKFYLFLLMFIFCVCAGVRMRTSRSYADSTKRLWRR